MSKEEYLSIAESYYAEFEALNSSPNFYDYEKSLAGMMQKLSSEYMEKQLNESSVTQDRRKKNQYIVLCLQIFSQQYINLLQMGKDVYKNCAARR